MKILFLVLTLACMGMSSCTQAVRPDSAMAAVEAGDFTVIIEGCGNQPIVGYTYCKVTEGDATAVPITIHVPPVQCREAQCVFWKVYMPDGTPDLGDAVPKGQTTVQLSWTKLLHRDKFWAGDRGFWPVSLEVHWVDSDGHDRSSFAEGEIRLRVLKLGYTSLDGIKDDVNFVWRWATGGYEMAETTGMRAYTGRKQ
jgi:hypothetical protein